MNGKKKEERRVPKLRFPGFTEDWEQRKLGELSSSFEYGLNAAAKEYDGENKYIRITDIDDDSREFKQKDITSPDTDSSSAENYRLSEGDILFARTGASVGKSYIYKASDGLVYYAGFLIRARIEPEYNSEFVFQNTLTGDYEKFIKVTSMRSGQPGVNAQEYSQYQIMVPSKPEQDKISNCLRNLDNLITLHQRKLEDLKEMKKGLLQKMFPKNNEKVPELRFPGFTEDWEQRKLEDFGKATGGTSIESEFSEDGIYKVISIGSYSENNVYNDQGIRAIKSDKTGNRVLNRNDLTMILNDKTTSGNIIGRVLLIEESGIYVYNQRTERIEIYLDEYDPVFLYEMLNAPNIREKIIKQAQGNTQIYVNWTAISLLEYMIPSKEEQVKIGEYLHSISSLITLHQRKLDHLKELKKGLLQQMFV